MNVIAYGSLMNQTSLEATLGRSATLTPITLPGFRRIFNAPFDGYSYLNLHPTPGSTIEAGCFELDPPELARFAMREAGSKLIRVSPGHYAFIWPQHLTRNLAVPLSYIEICRTGARNLGVNLDRGLIAPRLTIDDLEDPLYR